MSEQPRNITVSLPMKSVALSLVLTFFFGPLGLLYSSIWGGLAMLVFGAVIGIVTFGYGFFIVYPICMIWGAIATNRYNKKLLKKYS